MKNKMCVAVQFMHHRHLLTTVFMSRISKPDQYLCRRGLQATIVFIKDYPVIILSTINYRPVCNFCEEF